MFRSGYCEAAPRRSALQLDASRSFALKSRWTRSPSAITKAKLRAGRKAVKPYWPSGRDALKTAVTLLTVSVSARSLRLSASAQVPEKIVLGTLPIPGIVSSIGQVDFFKEEGLTLELTRFNNFAPVLQAMTTGS